MRKVLRMVYLVHSVSLSVYHLVGQKSCKNELARPLHLLLASMVDLISAGTSTTSYVDDTRAQKNPIHEANLMRYVHFNCKFNFKQIQWTWRQWSHLRGGSWNSHVMHACISCMQVTLFTHALLWSPNALVTHCFGHALLWPPITLATALLATLGLRC